MGSFYVPDLKEQLKEVVDKWFSQEFYYENGLDAMESKMEDVWNIYKSNIDDAEMMMNSLKEFSKEVGFDYSQLPGFDEINAEPWALRDNFEQAGNFEWKKAIDEARAIKSYIDSL